jgi:hypothetical protein
VSIIKRYRQISRGCPRRVDLGHLLKLANSCLVAIALFFQARNFGRIWPAVGRQCCKIILCLIK